MLIGHTRLQGIVAEVFVAAGCSVAEADRVAENLVGANLAGHDSHGVVRVARYLAHLESGAQVANQNCEVITQSESYALVDGHFGMGQTVGEQAVSIGIDIATNSGVAIVALRHAGHLGRAGAWAELAAASGIVSIHFMNVRGNPIVAPFGGVERRFGTNPIAIGVPVDGADPLIHDFATSVVAEGKARVASQGGPEVPFGSFVTGAGDATADPTALYGPARPVVGTDGDGALRAMGEHKGSGLAFMCDVLAGALTGSGSIGPERRTFCNGMLSIFLDPSTFDTDNTFAVEVADFMSWVRRSVPATGHDEVLAPGDLERLTSARRRTDGVELADGTWSSLVSAAGSVGVSVDRVD